jgi:hypothetical protein
MTTATMAMRRNQNLYRSQAKLSMGPISVGFVTVGIIAVLALLYLTQITKTSVYGYKVSELTTQQARLEAVKQEREVEAARLSALQSIQSSKSVTGLVPEQNVTYAGK